MPQVKRDDGLLPDALSASGNLNDDVEEALHGSQPLVRDGDLLKIREPTKEEMDRFYARVRALRRSRSKS